MLKALYSLAYLVKEGTHIPPSVWQLLGLTENVLASNSSILTELYSRSVSCLGLMYIGALVHFVHVIFILTQGVACVCVCVCACKL